MKRLSSSITILAVVALAACCAHASVTPGFDFYVNAAYDSDGNDEWEDLVGGNPSGLGLLLDKSPGQQVNRTSVSTATLLTHAYDFPGEAIGEQAGGAALIYSGGGTNNDSSFQNATNPTDWSDRNVTLEVWFRPDNLTPSPADGLGQILFEDGGGSGLGLFIDDNELICGQDTNTFLITYNLNTDPSGVLLDSATNEFIQAVVTREVTNGFTILYVNGVSAGTATDSDDTTSDWTGGDAAAFGGRGGSNVGGRGSGQHGESFDGEIALIRVYADQVLNATEVDNNFKAFTEVDTTAPTLYAPGLSPLDGTTDGEASADLVATFSEDVLLTGSGTITVKNTTSGGDTVIDLSAADADGSASASGSVLAIVLSNDLAFATSYAVQISANAIEDIAGNPFAGISDTTTWNFRTALQPVELARYDWTNLSSSNFASQAEAKHTTAGGFDISASTQFANANANAWNSDNSASSSDFMDNLVGAFTVTAASKAFLNLDTLTYSIYGKQTASATSTFNTQIVVDTGDGSPDTLAGGSVTESGQQATGFSTGSIDLSGAAYQGLNSVTITLYFKAPAAPGSDYFGILSTQSSGTIAAGNTVPGAYSSVPDFTVSDMILTGHVTPPPPREQS